MRTRLLITEILFLVFIPLFISAQGKEKKEVYKFEMVKEVKTTPIKNQASSGTCWSFATTSFVETELLRLGKGEHLLSPIFAVRLAYLPKAVNYIRYGGSANFGPGGQAHDVMNVIKEYGFVPEEIYSGMNIGEEKHNHGEMDAVLTAIVGAVNKNAGKKITPRWKEVFESTLNIYLGVPPKEFSYLGKIYTPKSFAESLGFKPEDYVELTSYMHHPFFSKFDLELPDNWSKDQYYNVPIDDLIKAIDNAIMNGYSVDWDGDVSEKKFDRTGLAIIPLDEEALTEKSSEDSVNVQPEKEKVITQRMRQETFDNRTTTDDHLMHIVGIAKDQNGTKYYYTKNSWGTKDKKYGGYWYMSESYVRLKTIAIMIHKDAIPSELKTKLGF